MPTHSQAKQLGPYYILNQEQNADSFCWLRVEIDTDSNIQLFAASLAEANHFDAINEWVSLGSDYQYQAFFVLDPESKTRVFLVHDIEKAQLLRFQYNTTTQGPMRPFIFSTSELGTPWKADPTQTRTSQGWGAEYDLNALLESSELDNELKEQIYGAAQSLKDSLSPDEPIDDSDWTHQKTLPINIVLDFTPSIGPNPCKLSMQQRNIAFATIKPLLEPLKLESQSKDEYLKAILAIMKGDTPQLKETGVSIETQANAAALRPYLFPSSINALGPHQFYPETTSEGSETTIADVYYFYLNLLNLELLQHGNTAELAYNGHSEDSNIKIGTLDPNSPLIRAGLTNEELSDVDTLLGLQEYKRSHFQIAPEDMSDEKQTYLLALINAILQDNPDHLTAANVKSTINTINLINNISYDSYENDLIQLQRELRIRVHTYNPFIRTIYGQRDKEACYEFIMGDLKATLSILDDIQNNREPNLQGYCYGRYIMPLLDLYRQDGAANDNEAAKRLSNAIRSAIPSVVHTLFFHFGRNMLEQKTDIKEAILQLSIEANDLAQEFENVVFLTFDNAERIHNKLTAVKALFDFYFGDNCQQQLVEIQNLDELTKLFHATVALQKKVMKINGAFFMLGVVRDFRPDKTAIIMSYGIERFFDDMKTVNNASFPTGQQDLGRKYFYEAGIRTWNAFRTEVLLEQFLHPTPDEQARHLGNCEERARHDSNYFAKIIVDYQKLAVEEDTPLAKAIAILQNFIQPGGLPAAVGFFRNLPRRSIDLNVVETVLKYKDNYHCIADLLSPLTEKLKAMLPDEKLEDPEHPFIRRLQYVYALGGKKLGEALNIELKSQYETNEENKNTGREDELINKLLDHFENNNRAQPPIPGYIPGQPH